MGALHTAYWPHGAAYAQTEAGRTIAPAPKRLCKVALRS